MDRKCLIPTNTAKPTFAQLLVLAAMPPISQAATAATGIFMQPPTVWAHSKIGQSQPTPRFCKLCTLADRKCLNSSLLPNNPEWSDLEEEEEDWVGEEQKEKERREKEHKRK